MVCSRESVLSFQSYQSKLHNLQQQMLDARFVPRRNPFFIFLLYRAVPGTMVWRGPGNPQLPNSETYSRSFRGYLFLEKDNNKTPGPADLSDLKCSRLILG
jgi:hypothetical protein